MNPMDRQTEGQEPQHQDRQPGIESKMNPLPLSEDEDYRGSGKLKGKVAIITGGDSGIGRAAAIAFAKEGADISILYLDEHSDAEETRKRIEKENVRCLLILEMSGTRTIVNKLCSKQWTILVNSIS